ncbi:MAG: hypothetical protein COX62_07755 [Deltaproteobacteria bacterium CG_4_10_14_0_2_um_filter_43_8]|nr:MAG: hypothetical protein COV43_01280 [Deltaproteobacteria bacterium CG11_big_fil_rev_8_21_14_0_20_42_23]PJA18893.1 MAG: hypothetical protein COX62_07755 [Deltaproteobacteria bacterium CG_4_10_14_0_2_um_filter_43_8]PJC63520.1 MAG: hypothetical protein CO021_08715 [Deltaproteobacteria bacterium CG_4_9_14_0_2_um_filter_42_21]
MKRSLSIFLFLLFSTNVGMAQEFVRVKQDVKTEQLARSKQIVKELNEALAKMAEGKTFKAREAENLELQMRPNKAQFSISF